MNSQAFDGKMKFLSLHIKRN